MSLASFLAIKTGAIQFNESQRAYFDSLNSFDHAATILLACMNLLGAVFLILLRKEAAYLFLVALVLNVFLTIWHALTKGFVAALSSGLIGPILGLGLLCVVCFYTWQLKRKQVLV